MTTPEEPTAAAKARVAAIIKEASQELGVTIGGTVAEAVVMAIEHDLATQVEQATTDHNRLAILERQTRVIAEAVVAITKVDEAVAPAVQAMQSSMRRRKGDTPNSPA